MKRNISLHCFSICNGVYILMTWERKKIPVMASDMHVKDSAHKISEEQESSAMASDTSERVAIP